MTAAASHELVWAAGLLDELPVANVLAVRVEVDSFKVDDRYVPMLTLDIHADSWADAVLMASSLRLPEVEGHTTEGHHGTSLWRKWSGWAAEGSRQAPVWVQVTAAERQDQAAAS